MIGKGKREKEGKRAPKQASRGSHFVTPNPALCPRAPAYRRFPGQRGQRRGALLSTAAAIPVAGEGLRESLSGDFSIATERQQPSQVGAIGAGPGGSAARWRTPSSWIGEKGLLEILDGVAGGPPRVVLAGTGSPVLPSKLAPLQLSLHDQQGLFGLQQPLTVGAEPEADSLDPLGMRIMAIRQGTSQIQTLAPLLQSQACPLLRQKLIELLQRAAQIHGRSIGNPP